MAQAPTDEVEAKPAEAARAEVPLAQAKEPPVQAKTAESAEENAGNAKAEVVPEGESVEKGEGAPEKKENQASPVGSFRQTIEAHQIDEQMNIQGQSIFITVRKTRKKNQEEQKPSAEEKLEDPTEPLPPRPREIREIEVEEYGVLLAEWSSRRTLLLSSSQAEPSLAVAYSLIHEKSLSDYEKRTLLLGKSKHRDRLDLTIEIFYRPDLLEKRRQIVLVEIERPGLFLDSVLRLSHTHAGVLQKFLRDCDSLLVCTVSSEILKLGIDQRQPNACPFGHHPLDRHDRREVLVRQEALPRDLATPPLEAEHLIKLDEIFREGAGVHGAVLYTATYFPDLTPHDFGRIVVLLLGDRTASEDVEEQIITEKGKVRTLKKKSEKRLADLWKEAPDRILRECRVRATPNGKHTMDFSDQTLRDGMRAHLESVHPMFLVRMFERLQTAGILFDPSASPDIVHNLVDLFVARTLSDPAFCGKDWLFSLMIGLESHTRVEIDPEAPSTERLFLILACLESERIRKHALGRLAQLICEMLRHDELLQVVQKFLSTLLDSQQHQAALDLLLELTRSLRFAPQFDVLLWLRRLIDQGSEEIRRRTFRCLVGLAIERGRRVHELLETLYSWLPPADLEVERYSLSSRSSLRFVLEYSAETLGDFDPRHFGQWPSRYPLFAALPEDRNAFRSCMELLCGWLLHRGMPVALESWVRDVGIDPDIEWKLWFDGPEEAHGALVADLMEQWVLVLEGFDSKPPHPEACRVTDELLAVLARRADPVQRKRLIRRWQERQQQCYVDVNQMPVEKREERTRLLATRKKLYELRQRFLSACPGGTSSEG